MISACSHEHTIKLHQDHLKDLQEKGPRAVKTLRLHEQTHVDITAKVAEQVNELLKAEADPIRRNEIIDKANTINWATRVSSSATH